jgi:hypothetical protein
MIKILGEYTNKYEMTMYGAVTENLYNFEVFYLAVGISIFNHLKIPIKNDGVEPEIQTF